MTRQELYEQILEATKSGELEWYFPTSEGLFSTPFKGTLFLELTPESLAVTESYRRFIVRICPVELFALAMRAYDNDDLPDWLEDNLRQTQGAA